MKSRTKKYLAVFGVIIFVAVGVPIFHVGRFLYGTHVQVEAGRKYMDSLTDKDIQQWIDRSIQYLARYDSHLGTGSFDIPPDLAKLRILRIDLLDSDRVDYVWCGGFEHTELRIERLEDRSFKVTAQYNDDHSRLLWPKQVDIKALRLPTSDPTESKHPTIVVLARPG